jgi:outer membrane beta-barrel protein
MIATLLALTLPLACDPPADAQAEDVTVAVIAPEGQGGDPEPKSDGDAAAAKGPEPGQCVDKTLQQELLAKRKYRLTKDRLFVKSLRHELTLMGGYYVSDLFDSTFVVGGAYTFFPSESFGSELTFNWSRLRTTTAQNIEESNNFDFQLGDNDVFRVFGTLLWSPLYGKLRLMGSSIWRYDWYLGAGPGVVVDPVSFGPAGNFVFGLRIFLHQAIALRFDVRDHLYRDELLREQYYVNDISFNAGFSVFLPPKN